MKELLPDLSAFDDISSAVCTTFPKRAKETSCEQYLFSLPHIIPYKYFSPEYWKSVNEKLKAILGH